MKKYFYSDGKKQYGPFSFSELKQQDINPDTLIWFAGLEDWTPAKDLVELEEILQLSPPPISLINSEFSPISNFILPDVDNSLSVPVSFFENKWEIESVTNIHPWRRVFARTIDLLTSGLLVFMLFSYIFGRTFPDNVDSYIMLLENPLISSIALYLVWIPTEALFLFLIGTTPAKWLFGIQVKGSDGENLSFFQSLFRAFQVFISGEGLGIASVVTRIFCYRSLRANGKMSWDSSVGSDIYYEKLSSFKIIVSGIITLLYLIVLVYSQSY
jgi:uncharacterized RDD family membrane protein YckC